MAHQTGSSCKGSPSGHLLEKLQGELLGGGLAGCLLGGLGSDAHQDAVLVTLLQDGATILQNLREMGGVMPLLERIVAPTSSVLGLALLAFIRDRVEVYTRRPTEI